MSTSRIVNTLLFLDMFIPYSPFVFGSDVYAIQPNTSCRSSGGQGRFGGALPSLQTATSSFYFPFILFLPLVAPFPLPIKRISQSVVISLSPNYI